MPALEHAELIDGIVFMPSPLTMVHGKLQAAVIGWLTNYAAATPGCISGCESTWILHPNSAPQPDAYLCISSDHGGNCTEGLYGSGAPELIVEICYSSTSYDLGPKLRLYERSGVQEYITVEIEERRLIWRSLVNGQYQPIQPDQEGILRSCIFPGLWLDPEALLSNDAARVLSILETGLSGAEHQEFVQRLAAAKK